MNALVNLGAAFQAPMAAAFAGTDAGDDLSGGITGGYGLMRYRGKVWAIHYQQQDIQLMRPDGDGPQNSIEVVILKANPHLSKTWYENGFDESSSAPPDCASANGVTPDAGVPKKQNNVCATCPRNQWGTAANGGKGKACGDHRRLAIVPGDDLMNEAFGGPMLLRCPAASLQDLAAFDGKYKQAGYPYFSMRVRIAFDPKESYPKFVFSAVRPLNEAEAATVIALRAGDQVARVISDTPAPAAEAPVTQQVAFEQGGNTAPAQTFQQPVQQVQPQAAPQHAPQQAQASTGGFGGAGQPAPATVAQPAQQPVQQAPQPQPAPRPSQTMTGFGAAAPNPPATVSQPAQQVVQPTPVQVAPQPAPAVAQPAANPSAFEASLDDKLAALIGTGSPT